MAARRFTSIALAALIPLALAACGDDDGGGSTDTTVVATETTVAGAPADDATIVIKDVAFKTPDVTVKVGGTVTFDNQDNQAHTATGADTGSFATDTIGPGTTKSVTFDEAGTFAYFCSFHPFMKGSVTVE